MTSGQIAPQQQRSRDTVARLLKATIETLEKRGLDGATIPLIAAAAGVAPASVYRRFDDRDALFRAAFMHALERGVTTRETALRLEAFPDQTLEGVVGRLVAIAMQQYRVQPGLMRALVRFIESDTNKQFRSAALEIMSGNFEALVELLLNFRDEITHPKPRRAITFALLNMATVIEVRALETVSMWHELLPLSDADIHAELTSNFLAYLHDPTRQARKAKKRKSK